MLSSGLSMMRPSPVVLHVSSTWLNTSPMLTCADVPHAVAAVMAWVRWVAASGLPPPRSCHAMVRPPPPAFSVCHEKTRKSVPCCTMCRSRYRSVSLTTSSMPQASSSVSPRNSSSLTASRESTPAPVSEPMARLPS